ncbi:MAG: hypothetical protein M1830_003023 [Pleopsidium flavum]|nr:MAG: hypothetical protein M1830_003023 [Pleopsidium flavum]
MQALVRPQPEPRNLPHQITLSGESSNPRTPQSVPVVPTLRVVSPEGEVYQIFPPPAPTVARYRPASIRRLQAARYENTSPPAANTLFIDPIEEEPSFLARIWNKILRTGTRRRSPSYTDTVTTSRDTSPRWTSSRKPEHRKISSMTISPRSWGLRHSQLLSQVLVVEVNINVVGVSEVEEVEDVGKLKRQLKRQERIKNQKSLLKGRKKPAKNQQ